MTIRWVGFQSPLGSGIEAFLTHKRALGCRFRTEDFTLRLLDRFLVDQRVTTLEDINAGVINAFLASRPRAAPRSYNHLLRTVARVFDWLAARDLVPRSPVCAKPRRVTRSRLPFLFDPATARRLLEVAGDLPERPTTPFRGPTYRTIFALLYGLGLRVGEVGRLRVADVDLTRRVLVVRDTKFTKSRLVPFGPRMTTVVTDYLDRRTQRVGPLIATMPVFSLRQGKAVSASTISQTFHQLLPRLALSIPEGTASPCVHCLRHSFAVGTLLRWYRRGIDPQSRLLQLSTFLGHVNPTSTAVYLTNTTELLAEASQRFERWADPLIQEVRS